MSTGSSSFFSTQSEAIGKDEFLGVYREVYCSAQLLCAPFGLLSPKDYTDGIEGLDEDVKKTYVKLFGEWEELLSRAVFEERGYSQDQIVASVNKYITGSVTDTSIQPDMEVMEQVRLMSENFPRMLSNTTPKIVAFDDDSQIRDAGSPTTSDAGSGVLTTSRMSFDLTQLLPFNAQLAALLLEQVIGAVSFTLYGCAEFCAHDRNDTTTSRSLVDSSLFEDLPMTSSAGNKVGTVLRVPKQVFSPLRQLLPSYILHHPQSLVAPLSTLDKQQERGQITSQSALFSFNSTKGSLEALSRCLHAPIEVGAYTIPLHISMQTYLTNISHILHHTPDPWPHPHKRYVCLFDRAILYATRLLRRLRRGITGASKV